MAELLKSDERSAFSRWPIILGWVAMIIFALHASTHMVGAGDTWVAEACGRHFVNHGVDTVEPFSANSHRDGPTQEDIDKLPGPIKWIANTVGLDTVKKWHPTGWVNQNWLTHVMFYWLTPGENAPNSDDYSFNALVYWKFAIYIIAVICVYYMGRILGANAGLSAAMACFAMFIGRSFLDIRPAGFTNMLTAVFLLVLVLATYRNVLYLWLIVPMTVFWCNVHGGYLYVFLAMVPFVLLHIFLVLPKRWTISLYSGLCWLAFYALTFRLFGYEPEFLKQPVFRSPMIYRDGVLYFLIALIIASVVLASLRFIKKELFYTYHIIAWVVIFFVILIRLFPAMLGSVPFEIAENPKARDIIFGYAAHIRLEFVGLFLGLAVLGGMLSFYKDKFVSIGTRGVVHGIAVGFASFVAMIIFNPFHLTNLTHTFVISVSKHAKLWKNVNEWHRGFEWSNPVGTSFPFLVMFVLTLGLVAFWIFSRVLVSHLVEGPANELESRKQRFAFLSKVFGWSGAVVAGWVFFIGFSFMNLNIQGFIISAAFVLLLLLSVFNSINFIFGVLGLTFIGMLITGKGARFEGMYYYPFLLVPCYCITVAVASQFSKSIKTRDWHILAALGTAVFTLIAIIIVFNPFKFTAPTWDSIDGNGIKWVLNATRAGINAWVHMFRVRPWHPAYEGSSPLGYRWIFAGLFWVNFLSVCIWFLLPSLRRFLGVTAQEQASPPTADMEKPSESYQLPKIDLALLVIAAMTIYMAIGSRRFIPIAAIAACPILAMIFDQMVRAVAAGWNYYSTRKFTVPPMPENVRQFLRATAIVFVMFFGLWFVKKYKYVYLDPWPNSMNYSSVFMRMTASHAKPFDAGRYIRDNNLRGNMFNYWTEGGFIAWRQNPDPETGKTPLQLFMDGRAQAAYEPEVFNRWTSIMSGGPTVVAARRAKRKLGNDDYIEVGKWVDQQLKDNDVWVVLMPYGQYNEAFVIGLDQFNPNWQVVYLDNIQKLMVDVSTDQGKKLFEASIDPNSDVKYPNEYSRSLVLAHNSFLYVTGEEAKRRALKYAARALELEPSQSSMQHVLLGARYEYLKDSTDAIVANYIEDFESNKKAYVKKDGYFNRIVAAIIGSDYLLREARASGDAKLIDHYNKLYKSYDLDRREVLKGKTW